MRDAVPGTDLRLCVLVQPNPLSSFRVVRPEQTGRQTDRQTFRQTANLIFPITAGDNSIITAG